MTMTRIIFWLALVLILAACTTPTEQGNRFQVASVETTPTDGPVAELQRKATAALAHGNSKQAIEYLQRAIKIEPRNAFSWHYLAQGYWQNRQPEKCLAMIDRSYGYSRPVDDLDDANASLRSRCQSGT